MNPPLRTLPIDGTIHGMSVHQVNELANYVSTPRPSPTHVDIEWVQPEWWHHLLRTVQPQRGND